LLLQRAVNEGELTIDQAANEKRKVKIVLSRTMAAAPDVFARLPQALRDLVCESCVCSPHHHLDQLLYLDPMRLRRASGQPGRRVSFARLRGRFQLSVKARSGPRRGHPACGVCPACASTSGGVNWIRRRGRPICE